MMPDRPGPPVTTASAGALAAYDDAVEGLLGWNEAAGDRFAPAAADPGPGFAHAGAAVALLLALLEACFCGGDLEWAARLLAERVARPPDAFWLARAAS